MYKIDSDDAVSETPIVPVADQIKYFKNAVGIPPAWWLNMIQDEMSSVVTDQGFDLDKTVHNQLLTSINKIISDKLDAQVMPYYKFDIVPKDGTATITGTYPSMGFLRWYDNYDDNVFGRGVATFSIKVDIKEACIIPFKLIEAVARNPLSLDLKIMDNATSVVEYSRTLHGGEQLELNVSTGIKHITYTMYDSAGYGIWLLYLFVDWFKNGNTFVE